MLSPAAIAYNTVYDGIAFFQAPIDKTTVQIAYKLSINEWQGKTNLQLMVEQIK
jgi:hypothetical protein